MPFGHGRLNLISIDILFRIASSDGPYFKGCWEQPEYYVQGGIKTFPECLYLIKTKITHLSLRSSPLKVTLHSHTPPVPIFLLLLKSCLEAVFCKQVEDRQQFALDLTNSIKTVVFGPRFCPGEQIETCRCQLWQIGQVQRGFHVVFGKKLTRETYESK